MSARQHKRLQSLAKATGDVVLGELLAWIGKYAVGLTDFNELAQMKVGRAL
jgi:hypothetical protein